MHSLPDRFKFSIVFRSNCEVLKAETNVISRLQARRSDVANSTYKLLMNAANRQNAMQPLCLIKVSRHARIL